MAIFTLGTCTISSASGSIGTTNQWNPTNYTYAYLQVFKDGAWLASSGQYTPPVGGTGYTTGSMSVSGTYSGAGSYTVRAFLLPNGGSLIEVGSASFVVPNTPTGVSASQPIVGVKNVSVSWGSLTSGAAYDIYARISGTSTFYYKASTSGSSATITLDSFSTYDLAIRAIIDGRESPTYGSASVTLYDLPTLSTPSISTQSVTQTSIGITLGVITGADTYYARINGGSWQSGSYPGPFNFTGLTKNTTYTIEYYCSAIGYINSNTNSSSITTPDNVKPDPWSWSASNGSASSAQTQAAYNAVIKTSGYDLSDFSYLVWNDLVDKVDAFAVYKSSSAVASGAKMATSDKALSALRFNKLLTAVNAMALTGITNRSAGQLVYGSYFTTITNALNDIT